MTWWVWLIALYLVCGVVFMEWLRREAEAPYGEFRWRDWLDVVSAVVLWPVWLLVLWIWSRGT